MYANLKIEITPTTGDAMGETLSAWMVETSLDGSLMKVYLDAADGESSYAVENGYRSISLRHFAVSISANF